MIRSWGQQTLSGNAQPCFGDVTTLAVPAPLDLSNFTIPVASTALYEQGDRIKVYYQPNPLAAPFTPIILLVTALKTSQLLQVKSEGDAPVPFIPSGSIIALDVTCFAIEFHTPTGTTAFWIGTDPTVTLAGAGTAFKSMLASTDYIYEYQNGANGLSSGDLWMAGTAAQKIGVAMRRL